MSFTWALMGPFSSEIWRVTVEGMLLNEGVQVVTAPTWDQVNNVLNDNSFDVLIAEFVTQDAPTIDEILSEHPTLAVASVDLSAFDTHFIHLDIQRFIALVSGLGRHLRDQELAGRHEPGDAPQAATNVVDFDRPFTLVRQFKAHGEFLAALGTWLDAAFSLVLERTIGLAGGRDIAGLTMDPQTARALLGDENSRRNAEELLQEMRAVEARLTAQRGQDPRDLLPLQLIEHRFQLDASDRKILWLTIAPEIDDRYARAIGVINDDLGRRRPTLALVAAAIEDVQGEWDVATRLAPHRPLARGGLVAVDSADIGTIPRSQSGLICPPDIVEFVMTGVPVQLRSATRLAA